VYEAKRFIVGHFSLWGTGQNTRTSWTDNFLSLVNLPYIFLFYTIVKYEKRVFLIYILSFFYLFWIIFAQNPDNIRHMIPLIFLFNILIASYFINKRILLIMILTLNLFTIFSYKEKLSPIDQIIKEIKNEERIVISNRSIEILRKSSNNAVVDKFYSNSADYVSSKNKTFTITTDKPKETIFKTFLGRFVGEHTFYLIKN
jgi:Zn-dependent protease with chaperone function